MSCTTFGFFNALGKGPNPAQDAVRGQKGASQRPLPTLARGCGPAPRLGGDRRGTCGTMKNLGARLSPSNACRLINKMVFQSLLQRGRPMEVVQCKLALAFILLSKAYFAAEFACARADDVRG